MRKIPRAGTEANREARRKKIGSDPLADHDGIGAMRFDLCSARRKALFRRYPSDGLLFGTWWIFS